MEIEGFDIPDDPDAMMAWLEMDGGFDVGQTTEEAEAEPETAADPLADLDALAAISEPEPEPTDVPSFHRLS